MFKCYFSAQIWSSWHQTAVAQAAIDSITNSSKGTYLMNMKKTKSPVLKYAVDSKEKNSVATKSDISNRIDEWPESKETQSKINQFFLRSQNSTESDPTTTFLSTNTIQPHFVDYVVSETKIRRAGARNSNELSYSNNL